MWLKRLNAPKFWRLPPKKFKYVVNPSPGPHTKDYCIPLAVVIRDILKLAENLKEAKSIISKGSVLVDQRVVKSYKYPCGLFDVISFPEINEHYRVSADKDGLILIKIKEEEKNLKIVKVKKKTKISPDTYQLTFHDGKNVLTKNNKIKPHDSLLIELPNLKILHHIPFKENSLAFVFRGNNCGLTGEIVGIVKGNISRDWLVDLRTEDKRISTIRDYVIVIGENKPLITY